jgi:hypothetical protein
VFAAAGYNKVETHTLVQTQIKEIPTRHETLGLTSLSKHMGLRFERERFKINNHDT